MTYLLLKQLHVALVLLSLGGFVLRGWWMLRESALLRRRLTRVLPHGVDTLLLASGVGLALWAHLNPLHQPWLMAKLVALLVYILLGTLALKRGRTRTIRIVALVAALGVYGYMLAVAIHHDPWPLPA
ncbi:MAG: SirB2 family protein [Gammaproteobacteria bacterium]|nr:SirB2 family protein [Gammaproteobacteria bacterium]